MELTFKNTTIICDRIRLRPLAAEDLPARVRWYNDPDVRKTLTVTEIFELEKTRQWFAAAKENPTRVDFAIETLQCDLMGTTGLIHLDFFHKTAECFCVIGEKTYWGGGLGTEVHSALIQWAFDGLGMEKIYAIIRTNNPAIYKVVQRLGFQIEGTLRQEMILEGIRQDVYRIGLLKAEFTPTHQHFEYFTGRQG